MSAHDLLFWAFALVTAGGAIAVVLSQNVVRMAFWLIVSLGSTAGLFFLLDADFVGTAQLLIYVGGTLVLLIFGVMLTASGPFVSMKTSPGEGVLAAFVGFGLLGVILSSVCALNWADVSPSERVAKSDESATGQEDAQENDPEEGKPGYNKRQEGNTTRALGLSLIGVRPDKDLGSESQRLSVGYLLPFEIVSVHLLVVLVGAAYLARAKRRKT